MIPEALRRELEGPTPRLGVRFYDHATLDGPASESKGRPVHKLATFIELRPRAPGLEVRDFRSRPATMKDRREYPHEYAHYEETKNAPRVRSLELLTTADPVTLADLRALGITTVEQLADLDLKACGQHLLEVQNADAASDEARQDMINRVAQALETVPVEFAEQIEEARRYVGLEQGAAPRVDDRDRGREDVGSVPSGRAEPYQPPRLDLCFDFGTFKA